MCKYCRVENRWDLIADDSSFLKGYAYIDRDGLGIEVFNNPTDRVNFVKNIKISYCPMCGEEFNANKYKPLYTKHLKGD